MQVHLNCLLLTALLRGRYSKEKGGLCARNQVLHRVYSCCTSVVPCEAFRPAKCIVPDTHSAANLLMCAGRTGAVQ